MPHGTKYTPLDQCMPEDTGNKRAVRILLECILVSKIFSQTEKRSKHWRPNNNKRESIPVGCILPTFVVLGGVCFQRGSIPARWVWHCPPALYWTGKLRLLAVIKDTHSAVLERLYRSKWSFHPFATGEIGLKSGITSTEFSRST